MLTLPNTGAINNSGATMVKEGVAYNGVADAEKPNPGRTVLPLLKFFNRHSVKSHQQQGLPEEQRENHHHGSPSISSAKQSASASADEARHFSAAATADLSTGDARASSGGEAQEPDHSRSSTSSSSKPATTVVIATASARRISLCRTTLGLDATSMPSTYEEDLKSSHSAVPDEENKGGAASEGAAAATDATTATKETSGADKRKKFKSTTEEEPHFSDEELLQFLGVRPLGGDSDPRETTRSHTISPTRRGKNSETAQGVLPTTTKLYALRMALGKAGSIARQLWGDPQKQQEQDSEQHSSNNADHVSQDNSNRKEQKGGVLPAGCVVIGADTIIEIDGQVLEKAADEQEAKQMLMRMSGKTHCVHTAVCIFTQKEGFSKPAAATVSTTRVSFVDLTEEDVNAYVETKQYEGKSGKLCNSICVSDI